MIHRALGGWRMIIIYAVLLGVLARCSSVVLDEYVGYVKKNGPLPHISNKGAVATENEICSKVGAKILGKEAATIVDAAIAASICIGTVNMYSTGLGGGGFMLVRQDGVDKFYDFREAAPVKLDLEHYAKNPESTVHGGSSVAVPGNLRGYEKAHNDFGGLPWNQLYSPSIKIAEEGWRTSLYLERRIGYLFSRLKKESPSYKGFMDLFFPGGVQITEGSIIRRPAYAKTLLNTALHGPDDFYNGEIARSIVNAVKREGGTMELDDLASYSVRESDVVYSTYKNYQIITTPLPTSGMILASMLKITENLGLSRGNFPESMRRLIEVFKYSYAQRSSLGDITNRSGKSFNKKISRYLSKEYVEDITRGILGNEGTTFEPLHYSPEGANRREYGTSHISVMDNRGNVALITSTINLPFGSLVMDEKTGIILNDEVDDFSVEGRPNYFQLEDSPHNLIEPRKRPMSSSTPAIIMKDGVPVLALGASGGSHIITAVASVVVNHFDFEYSVEESVELPRFHHQLLPNVVTYESDANGSAINALKKAGHDVKEDNFTTGVQVVWIEGNEVKGLSDKRKHGVAAII